MRNIEKWKFPAENFCRFRDLAREKDESIPNLLIFPKRFLFSGKYRKNSVQPLFFKASDKIGNTHAKAFKSAKNGENSLEKCQKVPTSAGHILILWNWKNRAAA